ncbi:MAG: aminotransferase class V-fold PLP-dependent enzyme [Saprospiraceae bacterium]|nr:aminotransferase class V-fold PLP-dependent enzyme [Saprospiraceae bacterium]
MIYLDNNATTATDPRVLETMLPYFYEKPGNAASRSHPYGWVATEAVDLAREQCAQLFAAETREVIFTSGATEAINLAIKGVFEMYHRKGKHIITVATEHKAVLDTCHALEKRGGEVTYLSVDEQGMISLEELEAAIRADTVLVAVMWANNETGVIQPIKEIGTICDRKGVLFFSDATQAVGKIPVLPKAVGVHLMAFSAHKLYGPKGVGGLFVNHRAPRVRLTAQLDGGGHEGGFRSGTLNVPGIVGMGKAIALAAEEMVPASVQLQQWRDQLENRLLQDLEEVQLNGHPTSRLAHVSNLIFRFVDAEALMATFNRDIAVSAGSACTSADPSPSHVLIAMGKGKGGAESSIRFSFGRFNQSNEVDQVAEAVIRGVNHLRSQSPVWEMFKEGIDVGG